MYSSYKDHMGADFCVSRDERMGLLTTDAYCGKVVASYSIMERSSFWAIVYDAIDPIGEIGEDSRKFLAYCVCRGCRESAMRRPGAFDWERAEQLAVRNG